MAVEASPAFEVESLPSIWDLDTHTEWLVEGLIPTGSVVMLSGDSGSGKSTLVLALAHAVAHGTPFLNRKTQQREVLIVDLENGKYTYCTRRDRLHLEKTDQLHVWAHWVTPEPSGPDDRHIKTFIKAKRPLVIFDSLIAFHPGSEQDSSETRDYMQDYRYLTAIGATVIIIHHTGKGENTKNYRGSSDIKASVDTAYVLTSKPGLENMRLRPFKSREGEVEEICIAYNDGYFSEEQDPQRLALEALLTECPGATGSELKERLDGKVPEHRLRKLLQNGVDNNTILMQKGDRHTFHYYFKGKPEIT